jgi:hypothetical protein
MEDSTTIAVAVASLAMVGIGSRNFIGQFFFRRSGNTIPPTENTAADF